MAIPRSSRGRRTILKMKNILNKLKKFIDYKRAKWKHRFVDPDLCCCGELLSKRHKRHFDSICDHGGCKQIKELLISLEIKKQNKKYGDHPIHDKIAKLELTKNEKNTASRGN